MFLINRYLRHLVEKDPSLMYMVMLAQAGPLSLANRLLGKEKYYKLLAGMSGCK
jgi:hypothetical protein